MAGRKRVAEDQFRPPRTFQISIYLSISIYIYLSIDTIYPSIFIHNIQLDMAVHLEGFGWRGASEERRPNFARRVHIYIHIYTYVYVYVYLCMYIYVCIYLSICAPGRLWTAGRKRGAEAQFRPQRTFQLSIHPSIYIDLSIDTICPSIFIHNIQLDMAVHLEGFGWRGASE